MEILTLSPNTQTSSVSSIRSLINDFQLEEADGSAEFVAEVDFLVRGKRKVTQAMVKILRDKEHYIITLLDRTLNSKMFPVEFKSGLQTFIYFVNEYLFIAGFSPSESIGSYTVSITPKQ